MIIPPSIQHKHDLVRPYIDMVADRVRDIVAALCQEFGFAYLGRKKDSESLAEKIETGRFKCWSTLDDLFACSIIVPTLSDEAIVIERLRASFLEVDCKRRGSTQKDPSVFRFDATRFIAKLRPETIPNAAEGLLATSFEIQVRSAFEHAWSVTTHALAYKSAQVDWRHLRVAAQLRAAVEQLDQVVVGFEYAAAVIPEQAWPTVQARQRIWALFSGLVEEKIIPTEVAPKSWGRFSENLLALAESGSDKRITNLVDYIDNALSIIEREIRKTDYQTFPRSISLMQFCTGAMAETGFLKKPSHRFIPLITTELLTLFPKTFVLGAGFDFEL